MSLSTAQLPKVCLRNMIATIHSRSGASQAWRRCVATWRPRAIPAELLRYAPGKVEDTLPAAAPDKIALLRLDTDWYESTRHELEHLFPRLSPGGVLIVDDYGHWQGARRAVDEYFAENGVTMLLNRIDYTGRIGVKVPRDVVAANSKEVNAA